MNKSNNQWLSIEDRLAFYFNDQASFDLDLSAFRKLQEKNERMRNEVRYISFDDFKGGLTHKYCRYLMPLPLFREIRALPRYEKYRNLHSVIDILRPFDQFETKIESFKFPFFYGEMRETDGLPVIRKSRKLTDQKSILYDLRSLRFNLPCLTVEAEDIDWKQKVNDVTWRGATTGQVTREEFVKKYAHKYDIGFSTVKQKPHLSEFLKNRISIKDQLKNKYVISLQGNDIASNIRWVLFSNSVPILPKPTWTSWIMESKLEPFVHYLELNEELSNLDELLDWAESNQEECQRIASNGKQFVSQFLDRSHDDHVRLRVLEEYAARVNIIE